MKQKIVVFLDRDGVINQQKDKEYCNSVDMFEFILGSPQAIKKLNDNGILVIVVTNQGGIEKGYMTEEDFLEIDSYMVAQLKKFGAKVEETYYCSSLNSFNRKPNPGMLLGAIKDYNLQKYKKYMVGDKATDMEAGNRALCETILVKTGSGAKEEKKLKKIIQTPNHIVNNLKDAVNLILKQENLSNSVK